MAIEDWETRNGELWAALDELGEDEFLARMRTLCDELAPGSAVAAFERGAAYDSTGHSDRAVPLYREALAAGLEGGRRRRAVIQMASSLRNLGQVSESIALLEAELGRPSDALDGAVSGFLEAVSLALQALAPYLPRYQRSLGNYAQGLVSEQSR